MTQAKPRRAKQTSLDTILQAILIIEIALALLISAAITALVWTN